MNFLYAAIAKEYGQVREARALLREFIAQLGWLKQEAGDADG